MTFFHAFQIIFDLTLNQISKFQSNDSIFTYKNYIIFTTLFLFYGCAYFNTFYNAKQYYEEAEKLRLEKDGESIPITAMDKYAKTIKKCQTVINDFPKSKYVIEARLLMSKARYYRSDLDIAINDLGEIQKTGTNDRKKRLNIGKPFVNGKKVV